MEVRKTGDGYSSLYERNTRNLMLNCRNYTGNAREECLWSTNSLIFVADWDENLGRLGQAVLGRETNHLWTQSSKTANRLLGSTIAIPALLTGAAESGAILPAMQRIGSGIVSQGFRLGNTLYLNPETWAAAEDIINVLTPPITLPRTWPGFGVCVWTHCWDPN